MTARSASPWPTRPIACGAFALALTLLAGCVEQPPPTIDFAPLRYDYLTKLRLNVARVDVSYDLASQNFVDGRHVEALSPVQPADALRQMAQDRLVPAGSGGHAVFVIDDASLLLTPAGFEGTMQVHLDVTAADGTRTGTAQAGVHRTRTVVDESPEAERAALYELTQQMMSDMNVEFEYQVRRSLHEYLEGAPGVAPPPAPVQQQDLNGGTPDAPAPADVPPSAPLAPPEAAPPAPRAALAPTPLTRIARPAPAAAAAAAAEPPASEGAGPIEVTPQPDQPAPPPTDAPPTEAPPQ